MKKSVNINDVSSIKELSDEQAMNICGGGRGYPDPGPRTPRPPPIYPLTL